MTTSLELPVTPSVRALFRTALAAVIGAVVLAGCSVGGPSVDPANDPAPAALEQDDAAGDQNDSADEVVTGDEYDLAAFCAQAGPMMVPVEREYIGSDEHVEDFRALRAVAPENLDAAIALLIGHYDFDVSPSDPDSQDFENFPADVQEAALLLGDEINARC